MKFEQLLSKAKIDNEDSKYKDTPKIYIGSSDTICPKDDVIKRFKSEIEKRDLSARIIVTGSYGYYDLEPFVLIEKHGKSSILYHNVSQIKALEVVNKYLINDDPCSDLAFCQFENDRTLKIPLSAELPLFSMQKRVALRNCGHVDPENIAHYIIATGGYRGLLNSLMNNRLDLANVLSPSGLKDPGNEYSVAEQWRNYSATPEIDKYLVCNALSADPDDLTVNLLLESDPHDVLEGMLISAYAIGASHCIICIKTDSVLVQKLNNACEQMRKYGLLGYNIMGSNFTCEMEIRQVEASLPLLEKSALLNSLENNPIPPGLHTPCEKIFYLNEKPALVNRAETFARVSAFFQNDTHGSRLDNPEYSQGTQIISLKGQITHKYTVEVPIGITLEKITARIGGGVPGGKSIKAIQFGGPTGTLLAGDALDRSVQSLGTKATDSALKTNTLAVFDSDSCIVEIVNELMAFIQTQSCGKCVFCREGTYQMSHILKDISKGSGRPQDLDLLIELSQEMQNRSICGLGRKAPDPVLSSINLFREDYESHIGNNVCPRKQSS